MSRFALLALIAFVPVLAPARGQETPKKDDIEVIDVPKVPDKNPSADLVAASKAIVEATNAFRKAEKHPAVAVEDKLAAAAQGFAEYMAKTDRYGHTADGTKPADRTAKQKYEHCIVLENIAYAFNSEGFAADKLAEQFTTGWKESPGHRKNMLDPDVTETAVAIARSEKTGHYYAVQLFARPKAAAIAFKVENKAGEEFAYTVGDESFKLEAGYTRTHTVCRPTAVAFRWPGATADTDPVKPTGGQKFVVTKAGDRWAAKAE